MTQDTGASAEADRAVVNGAASVSAVPASVPSASALRKVAAQIRHRLSDMELRSNVSWPASSPAAKTSGYIVSEVADWQLRQWLHIIENNAQAIEAGTAKTEGLGPKDESAVACDEPHIDQEQP